jgi:hypothetical protein
MAKIQKQSQSLHLSASVLTLFLLTLFLFVSSRLGGEFKLDKTVKIKARFGRPSPRFFRK